MRISKLCPSCYSNRVSVFYKIQGVPVNSVLLLTSQEEALNFPKGDITLGFCQSCGFIYNLVFNSSLLEYSTRYEATQSCSPSFNAFHRRLAENLIDRYGLRKKDIIEIGCGQGEFLALLCGIGDNRGVGFDPVYADKRGQNELGESTTFIKELYSEKFSYIHGDFVCCKMTLEHIQDTEKFIGMIRRNLHHKLDTTVFFQVPDSFRILREIAFWDIYYEHCSYFSLGSLARLFRQSGFDIIDLEKGYDDQYLLITVKPGTGMGASFKKEDDLLDLNHAVSHFVEGYQLTLEKWQRRLDAMYQARKRMVIWGASSKAVSFLTILKITKEIEFAVDINPLKNGTYIAGTGQKIVPPEFLKDYRPDVVIIMNPIYMEEIKETLEEMGVDAELLPV